MYNCIRTYTHLLIQYIPPRILYMYIYIYITYRQGPEHIQLHQLPVVPKAGRRYFNFMYT